MSARFGAFIAGGLALALVQCQGPNASGSKTNWFQECDQDAECGDEGECTCGLCTHVCADDAGCETGRCAAELETSTVCQAMGPARICLPSQDAECVAFDVLADPDLGAAVSPSCENEAALVCESFDDGLPEEYSTWVEGEMTASIQDCDVFAGAGAMRYQSEAPGQAQTRVRLPSAIGAGSLHARIYLKLDGQMTLPEQLQVLEFWDREESDVPGRIALFLTADGVPAVFVGASSTTLMPTSPAPLGRDTWICLELALDLDPADGSATLLQAGREILSGGGFATRPEEAISVVVVEGQPTMDTEGVNLFVDELVVSTGPIGCL
jgi:hypothetical protein